MSKPTWTDRHEQDPRAALVKVLAAMAKQNGIELSEPEIADILAREVLVYRVERGMRDASL